ncbi:MAG: ATP-binding protein [Thermodesulfobacteriota bacterium]
MERSLKVLLEPTWDEIEKARNRTSDFLNAHGLSNDAVQALTMVVSELIENSVKYGRFASPASKIVVTIDIEEKMTCVEVVNPIDETVYKHLQNLDMTIQWIRGHQDPFEAYIGRMREISKRPLDDKESGLGLVRISYEGRSIIDFFLGENGLLSVSAISNY